MIQILIDWNGAVWVTRLLCNRNSSDKSVLGAILPEEFRSTSCTCVATFLYKAYFMSSCSVRFIGKHCRENETVGFYLFFFLFSIVFLYVAFLINIFNLILHANLVWLFVVLLLHWFAVFDKETDVIYFNFYAGILINYNIKANFRYTWPLNFSSTKWKIMLLSI